MIALTRRRDATVALFFLCFFGVLCSGRLASSDAGDQLRAAMALATTRSLALPAQAAPPGWVAAADGRRYQPHDIGNIVLMFPAALLAASLSSAPADALIADPPELARALVSVSCAALAAVASFWLFRFFSLLTGTRAAFLLALAFPLTTIFVAYARAAWDVLGACCFMCGVLYYSLALAGGQQATRCLLMLAATLAAACSFRFPLAPFFVPAAAFCAWRSRQRVSPAALAGALLLFAALMAPTFVYNAVRTGSPLRPATAAPMYLYGANALNGSIVHGAYGLLLSPNRGLFIFSPVLLAALALPLAWRAVPDPERRVIGVYTGAAVGYLLLISKLSGWGTFGWGPRYLVPIVPIIFVAAAAVARQVRGRAWRAGLVALAMLSTILTLPTAVINWSLAIGVSPAAIDPNWPAPRQHVIAWQALRAGLRGAPQLDLARGTPAAFPDWLLVRAGQRSRTANAAAMAILLLTATVAATCMRRVLSDG